MERWGFTVKLKDSCRVRRDADPALGVPFLLRFVRVQNFIRSCIATQTLPYDYLRKA